MRALSTTTADGDSHGTADTQLEFLMSSYGDALHSFARTLTGDTDVAADCTQHAFLRAYEHLREGRAVNRAWLYTTARNAGLDWLRQRRRIAGDDHALRGLEMPPTGSPDRIVALRAALDRLSPEDREVLYLFTVDRFRAAEIGAMIGVGVDAVRMRLFRARERLRALYGECQ